MDPSQLLGSCIISHRCLVTRATASGVVSLSLITASVVNCVRAQVGSWLCCETTSLGHRGPHRLAFPEIVYGVGDSAPCSFSPWFLLTQHIYLPFHPWLQHSNGLTYDLVKLCWITWSIGSSNTHLVLAMGSNCRFGSGSGSYPDPDPDNVLYNTKNLYHCDWAGIPPQTHHFNLTTLASIKYLSFDCIVTWSIHRLYSFACCFPSRIYICNPTIIRWVAINNPCISPKMWCYFTAIQQIVVQLQI
jgi:hypothetical protein